MAPVVQKRKLSSEDNAEDDDLLDSVVQVNAQKYQKINKKSVDDPTADEIHGLRETEELFKNNLFKWQLEELLKSVRVKYATKCAKLEKAFWKIKDVLENSPLLPPADLNLDEITAYCKKKSIEIPFPAPAPTAENTRYSFKFSPPSDVRVVGSYMLRAVEKGRTGGMNADLIVEMPKEIFQDKDHLNHRYFHKRAYYLAILASQLLDSKQHGLKLDIQFAYLNRDQRRPIIIARSVPNGSEFDFSESKFSIRIIPVLSDQVFAPQRLAPSRNAVRPSHAQRDGDSTATMPPTPHYNNALLSETQMQKHLNFMYHWAKQSEENGRGAFKDAAVLLKIWLRQRGLDTAESTGSNGGINGFLLTMIMAYLFTPNSSRGLKLSTQWSSYQLFHAVIGWLASHDIFTLPVFMTRDGKPVDGIHGEGFTAEAFLSNFDVVVVDPSGQVNLAGRCSRAEWMQLQKEAQLTAEMLRDSTKDYFDSIFLRPISLQHHKYDSVFYLPSIPSALPVAVTDDMLLDFASGAEAVIHKLPGFLAEALTTRIKLVTVHTKPLPEWNVKAAPSASTNQNVPVWIGLILDPEQSCRVIDHGPSIENKEAIERFRQIWGSKSELRRFQNGEILESVVWEVPTNASLADRATIVEQMIRHLFKLHCSIGDELVFFGNQLFPLVKLSQSLPTHPLFEQNVNAFQPVMSAFESFVKQLRNLEDIPLALVDVRPAHSGLRYSSLLIPQPRPVSVANRYDAEVLPFIEPLDVVIQLESSFRWPNDLAMIQKMRLAFYVQIADEFEKTYPGSKAVVVEGNITAHDPHGQMISASGYMDITTSEGFTYRCRIQHDHELAILNGLAKNPKTSATEKSIFKESIALYEYHFLQQPGHSQHIQALVHRFPALSHTIRILKRWISSHWLSTSASPTQETCVPTRLHICDELIELICVKVFTDPFPFSAPSSAWTGFLRALNLIATWNWKDDPMIVELEEKASSANLINKVTTNFQKTRSEDPLCMRKAMFIAPLIGTRSSEFDMNSHATRLQELWLNSPWSAYGPNKIVVQRLQQFARASIKCISGLLESPLPADQVMQHILQIFVHPTKSYDVLIHLDPKKCARYYQSIVVDPSAFKFTERFKNEIHSGSLKDIRVGFDPVQCLMGELQDAFGHFSLFFHDANGGSVIGVVLNPQSIQPRPFKVGNDIPCTAVEGNENTKKSGGKSATFAKFDLSSMLSQMAAIGEGLITSIQVQNASLW